MSALLDRAITVTVGTIQIRDLAMSFKVKRTLKPEPNTADITIWNLNADHRRQLEQLQIAEIPIKADKKSGAVPLKKGGPGIILCQIEAGYTSGTSVLFVGDLRTGYSPHEGPQYKTVLTTGDGETKIRTARISTSLAKGAANPAAVLKAVAKALGVGDGNLTKAVQQVQAAGISNHFSEGWTASGSVFREMNAICRTCGLTWSVQNGVLQILPLGKALEGTALDVSESTGMVGSPTVGVDGVLKVKTLLIPDVIPGRLLVLKSEALSGNYRIESVESTGDTHGTAWYHSIVAKRY